METVFANQEEVCESYESVIVRIILNSVLIHLVHSMQNTASINLQNVNCGSSIWHLAHPKTRVLRLHRLLRLNLSCQGKNKKDLKGQSLSTLQLLLKGVRYFIISKLSVFSQTMFGWIHDTKSQVVWHIIRWNINFLVGDVAHLPTVTYNSL